MEPALIRWTIWRSERLRNPLDRPGADPSFRGPDRAQRDRCYPEDLALVGEESSGIAAAEEIVAELELRLAGSSRTRNS